MNLWLLDDRDWHPPQAVLDASGATLRAATALMDAVEAGWVELRVRDGLPEVRLRHGHQMTNSTGEANPARPQDPPGILHPSYR